MAAVTPSSTLISGGIGDTSLLRATFADTTDDGDTWASGLGTRVVDYWAQEIDNPSTQASTGVAVVESSGTFTFHPAEDEKPFYLFVRISGC